jgi:hypothetical protein
MDAPSPHGRNRVTPAHRPCLRTVAFLAVADQQAAMAELQGEPARLVVVLDFPRALHRQLGAEFIANDKPFFILRGQAGISRQCRPIRRRRSAATSKPRPTIAIRS